MSEQNPDSSPREETDPATLDVEPQVEAEETGGDGDSSKPDKDPDNSPILVEEKGEEISEEGKEEAEDFSEVELPVVPSELTEAVSNAHTAKTKFSVLKKLTEAVEISDRDLVDTVFNLLVGGEFDLETNFIISDGECIIHMVDLLESCSPGCQAEIWSKFKGICRKSSRNLQACCEAGLLEKLLIVLKDAGDMIADLLIDMLSLMTSYSITVKELKLLLSMLRGENGTWPLRAVQLLKVLQQTPERHGPDCFFMFPGVKDAAIALPPVKVWPSITGFTFTTWFQMEPVTTGRVDVNKPYLYCFRNSKGLGYSGHFVGNCLIVTFLKAKDKGFQHCVKYEFKPNKWHMVSIVHIYNRWRTSEIKCYANGQLVSTADMNWCVGHNEQFDKCFLGSAETTGDNLRVFSGKMGATYVFSEPLNPSQVYAIYQLGPDYKNQFKFVAESDRLLANHHRKVLYEDSKLSEHLMLAYNPKATDGQLCLESSPRPPNKDGVAHRWFVHSPHALMLHGVKAVVTHSIHCALHSVGGIDVLYPLFSQLNFIQPDGSTDTTVCLTILKFILQLMKGSCKTQQQILQGKGFLVIGHFLEKADKQHITMEVLDVLLTMAKFLDTLQNSNALLRQFCDHVFFNPALWIHTDPKVQLALYTYLATEFVTSTAMQTTVRRVSSVLIFMHSLKHYYWVVNPQDRSGITPKGLDGPRPDKGEIMTLRAFILLFLKQIVTRSSGNLDDEIQTIISYLITIHEDDNVLDVVQLLVALMSEHSNTVAPVFDNHDGIAVIFKLMGSASELIRVHALKLLAYFLKKCADKRKQDLLTSHSLFVLIGERLMVHADSNKDKPITMTTYNALYELLIEEPHTQVLHKPHGDPNSTTTIKNPVMMKVIANHLRQFSNVSREVMQVRIMFLNDLIKLFKNNRDNRRILLQQSVWQEWMLALSYLRPKNADEKMCQQLVFTLFRILLFHAVKLEWGGWRVWVDTLAIVHSKVTFEAHRADLEKMYKEYKNAEAIYKKRGAVSAITGSAKPGLSTDPRLSTPNEPGSSTLEKSTEKADQEETKPTEPETVQSNEEPDDQSAEVKKPEEEEETPTETAETPSGYGKDGASQSESNEATDEVDQDTQHQSEEPQTEEAVAKEDSHQTQTSDGNEPEEKKDSETPEKEESEEHADQNVQQQEDNNEETQEKTESEGEKEEEAENLGKEEETSSQPEAEVADLPEQDAQPESEVAQTTEPTDQTEDEVVEADSRDENAQEEKDVASSLDSGAKETDGAKNDVAAETSADQDSEPESSRAQKDDPVLKKEMPPGSTDDTKTKTDTVAKALPSEQEKTKAPPAKQVSTQQFSPGPSTSVFRIPEFKWSWFHLRLYNDLFIALESEMEKWKDSEQPLVEVVNSNDNVIFVHNTIHLVSQTVDNVILACGGILPILSSATSPNYELDTIDSSQGLTMTKAWSMLNRLASAMDVLAYSTTLNFADIEQEKNMSTGGILRQCLRIACMCAVRNCLENRYLHHKTPKTPEPKTPVPSDDSVPLHAVVDQNAETLQTSDSEFLSAVEAADILLSQMSNSATTIVEFHRLLQDADVGRLRSVIYRDVDDHKQAQFLSLAVVYFVSVLMVSKYRDILDPDSQLKLLESTVARKNLPNTDENLMTDSIELEMSQRTDSFRSEGEVAQASNGDAQSKEEPKKPASTVQGSSQFHSFDRSVTVAAAPKENQPQTVSESAVAKDTEALPNGEAEDETGPGEADHEDLPQINTLDNVAQPPPDAEESLDISKQLERSLEQLAPLLRDIFLDFSSYLTKVLVGSHGQELLVEGLVCMKSYSSVVELVMLLCSQEWQNSIQKNAGLAFIELINEGRLHCHSMKEHIVRVANEAEFILNKQRSEDVKKHADFESWCAVLMMQQRSEERQCDLLISAAKHRDQSSAMALYNRITNIMTNKHGAWGEVFLSRSREFWKLDSWEDDTRRRRRFVRNPYGSTHPEATLAHQLAPVVITDAAVTGKFPSTPKAVKIKAEEAQASSSSSDEDEDSMTDSVNEKELEDLHGPVTFTTECDLIAPGVVVQGTFSVTTDDIFFEVNENHESYKKLDPMVAQYTEAIHGKWSFNEVRAVFSRRYLLQVTAVEIFLANRTSVMFNFPDNSIMKKVVNSLPKVGIGTGYGLPATARISLATPRQLFKQSNMTKRWQQRDVSNYEYLMFLNTISGRTYNDLNQYPVFPWVLTNYESEELDLSLPSNYRDMSKPIGALNPKRKAYFESRYENWDDPHIPKFHYGTHYSNAAFTLAWLVRVEPFTSLFLNLQGGKFDHADRTFSSLLQSWKNCQRDSHDVKELIPEFFHLPEMFLNANSYNLGTSSEKVEINHVKLPPWAKSADDFVKIHKMALESEIVSCQLHQWIDLIFGYKQRGIESARATNVFYYLTYENAVNLNEITDPIEKMGLKDQIRNFGQTPGQLVVETHPPRSSRMTISPMMFKESSGQDVVMVLKFLSNSPVTHVAANTHPSLNIQAIVTCTQNLQFCINKWNQVNGAIKPPSTLSSNDQQKQILPVEPDPLMNAQGALNRRQISDMLDQSVSVHSSCFVVTADNRFLLSCGYWDRSIRIISTETGKLHQVIFGHWDVVTCLTRSDTYIGGDCYIVSGSRDATLLLWYWNGRRNKIIADSNNAVDNPTPRAVLTGHDTEVIDASVCAELGVIASASLRGPVLLHTITGDLLRTLQPPEEVLKEGFSLHPYLIKFSSEGIVYVTYENGLICNFTMNGRGLNHKIVHDGIKAIALSSDGEYLLTGGDKGILQVWDSWDLKHLYTFPQCDAGIRDIDLSHDQKTVITGMTSGSIVVFRIDFNKWHHEFQNKF